MIPERGHTSPKRKKILETSKKNHPIAIISIEMSNRECRKKTPFDADDTVFSNTIFNNGRNVVEYNDFATVFDHVAMRSRWKCVCCDEMFHVGYEI